MKKLIGSCLIILLSGLCVHAQSAFDKKIAEVARSLVCEAPSEETPVTLNATIVKHMDSIAVMVKAQLAPGWHIYRYVPPTLPYIPIEHILHLPVGLKAVGKWEASKPSASSTDRGVLQYEKEALFVHKLIRVGPAEENEVIETGLYYQACDLRQCLPPEEKKFKFK